MCKVDEVPCAPEDIIKVPEACVLGSAAVCTGKIACGVPAALTRVSFVNVRVQVCKDWKHASTLQVDTLTLCWRRLSDLLYVPIRYVDVAAHEVIIVFAVTIEALHAC